MDPAHGDEQDDHGDRADDIAEGGRQERHPGVGAAVGGQLVIAGDREYVKDHAGQRDEARPEHVGQQRPADATAGERDDRDDDGDDICGVAERGALAWRRLRQGRARDIASGGDDGEDQPGDRRAILAGYCVRPPGQRGLPRVGPRCGTRPRGDAPGDRLRRVSPRLGLCRRRCARAPARSPSPGTAWRALPSAGRRRSRGEQGRPRARAAPASAAAARPAARDRAHRSLPHCPRRRWPLQRWRAVPGPSRLRRGAGPGPSPAAC